MSFKLQKKIIIIIKKIKKIENPMTVRYIDYEQSLFFRSGIVEGNERTRTSPKRDARVARVEPLV